MQPRPPSQSRSELSRWMSVGDANIDWSKHVETHTLVLLSAVGRIADREALGDRVRCGVNPRVT